VADVRKIMSSEEIPPYAKRLCTAREQAGRSIEEMAALLDINTASYWDLETHDEEVLMCLSIQQVSLLCRTLNLAPTRLFVEEYREEREAVSAAGLAGKIAAHIEAQQIDLAEFGERAGWDVEALLERPEELMNVDALKHICREIGVNWVAVLSETIHQRS
jgi:transcriptional regulator with XRE-family HTH domain